MGSSSWSNDAYANLRSSNSSKTTDQIFTQSQSKTTAVTMDPKGLKFRESRDSDAHPESLAVIAWLDVTGSMGRIPDVMVREKLGALMSTLISHGINDAHVLFGAIGDHHTDKSPLQVGQFEAGTEELSKCLSSAYLEGHGGGQSKESYLLAWLIAARHTSIDCFEKRSQKGILFTIGDEASWDNVSADRLKEIMGYSESEGITDKDILLEAQRLYHVFHIHVNEGSYKNDSKVLGYWKRLLGERLIILDDYNNIAELIASTVALIHGVDLEEITKSFDSKTATSIKNALVRVDTSVSKKSGNVINL